MIEEIDCEEVIKKRCTARKADNEMLDKALIIWFLQERSRGTPISGDLIIEKAKQLHEVLQKGLEIKDNLELTSGFLNRFKERHGIGELSVSGEKLSSDY